MNETPAPGQLDVLIQGAGIGGLTLAIALLQRGYTVTIVERSASLSEVGAGIWMAANPMQVFDQLGFSDKIAAAGWPIHQLHLQDDKGNNLQTTDLTEASKLFGFETIALHRATLQQVLFDKLPPKTILFSTEIQSLIHHPNAITAHLTNDSQVTAQILVGADGINSRVRELLSFGGEKRYSGSSSYRAIARNAAILPHGHEHDAYELWGKGCRVGFSHINTTDVYWYMTFDSSANEASTTEQRHAHARSIFQDHFPQWLSLLEHTAPEEILRTDIADLKPLSQWSSHRAILIGDAAHATTPNLGQGGAMAVEDALILTNAFRQHGLNETALTHFELQRRKKVGWVVSTSWTIGQLCHLRNPLARILRNAFLRNTPKSVGRKQLLKLYTLEQ